MVGVNSDIYIVSLLNLYLLSLYFINIRFVLFHFGLFITLCIYLILETLYLRSVIGVFFFSYIFRSIRLFMCWELAGRLASFDISIRILSAPGATLL